MGRKSSCFKMNQMIYTYSTFVTDSSTTISRPKIAEHKKYMSPYQHMQKSMIQTIVFIQDYNKNLQCLGALLDKNLVAYPRDCWNSSLMLQAKVRCNDNTHIYIQMKAPKTEICQISRGVNIIESEVSSFIKKELSRNKERLLKIQIVTNKRHLYYVPSTKVSRPVC